MAKPLAALAAGPGQSSIKDLGGKIQVDTGHTPYGHKPPRKKGKHSNNEWRAFSFSDAHINNYHDSIRIPYITITSYQNFLRNLKSLSRIEHVRLAPQMTVEDFNLCLHDRDFKKIFSLAIESNSLRRNPWLLRIIPFQLPFLTTLDLETPNPQGISSGGSQRMDDLVVFEIARALPFYFRLKSLSLKNNLITEVGVTALSVGLHGSSVTTLQLDSNFIEHEGIERLLQLALDNKNLTTITYDEDPDEAKLNESIRVALIRNSVVEPLFKHKYSRLDFQ